jgi:hypothetical protein
MRWPWWQKAELCEPKPRRPVNSKVVELETAKEILAEIFHARPSDVEDRIQRRLEERSWIDEGEDGPWPAMFCLGE